MNGPPPRQSAPDATPAPGDGDGRRLLLRWLLLGGWPVALLFVLAMLDVRLGQPHLFYRYSIYGPIRLIHALPALAIGCAGVFALHAAWRGRGRAWGWAAAACYVALVGWTFVAPPSDAAYHIFNLESPSHEGAFTIEARHIESVRTYVSDQFFRRLALEPENVGGRRLLSNPQGMTVAARLAHELIRSSPGLYGALDRWYDLKASATDAWQAEWFAAYLVLAAGMTVVWGASLWFAYRLCRLCLPPAAAMAIGFACVFNPATVNFTPGKDPAQLLTVLAMLWTWMAGYRSLMEGRPRPAAAWCAAAGAIFVVGASFGLIHAWVLLIAAAATLWDAWGTSASCATGVSPVSPGTSCHRLWFTHCAAPAAAGAAVACSAYYAAIGWNIPLTILRVGQRYGQIQEGVIADPLWMTGYGLPLFLLFAGPALFILLAQRDRVRDLAASFAGRVLVCTLAVMVYSYFFANNNETPRLWIPFIPLLLVPMAMRRRAWREERGLIKVAVALMIVQLSATVLHWTLMDVRETEYRLDTGRYFE
jgi:hypothetical protein